VSWQQRLTDINRPWRGTDLAVVAHLHADDLAASFAHSLMDLQMHDRERHRRLLHPTAVGTVKPGMIPVPSGGGRLAGGRNMAVNEFLRSFPDGEWLLFIDSDMSFEADALDRLIESADPESRPVVGGLCFGRIYQGHGPGPFGAKGMGEGAMLPIAAAVANAIEDAVGVRITELPITPERVLMALQAKQERAA
jgi:hypothetical protein